MRTTDPLATDLGTRTPAAACGRTGRSTPRRAALRVATLLLAAVVVAACSGRQVTTPTWEETGPVEPAPRSSSVDAAAAFEAAEAAYAVGRYDAALEAFRMFGAEHPNDVLAVRAEIYAARCLAALGRTLEAEGAFASLYTAPDGPGTRAAAAVYVAFVGALRGETGYALEFLTGALADQPDLRVPLGWVVPGDEGLLASLLAEARLAGGRGLDALADLETVAAEGDETLVNYAIDRALEVAEAEPDRRVLQRAFDEGGEFAVAAIAPVLAARHRAVGDAEAAREVLLRAELPAARWGRPERLAEELERLSLAAPDRDPRYGVALSLTGPTRRAGRAALGAILLAQRAFEDRPALSTVVIRDTGGTEAGTRRAIDELAAEGVSAIIGPVESELADAARDAARAATLPLVLLSPTPFDRRVDGTFRWMLDARSEARAVVAAAAARAVRTFVIVREPADVSAEFFDAFVDAATDEVAAIGGSVRDVVTIYASATDAAETQDAARRAATQIASADAQGVIFALPDELTATLVAHLAAENVWPSPDGATRSSTGRRQMTYVTSSFAVTEALLRNSAAYVRGAILPYWFDAELAEGAARQFADRFAFTYGRDAGTVEAFAFDAATALRRLLLDESALSPDRIAARLAAGVDIAGVVGPLRFDATGNPLVEPRLCTVRGERLATP